MIQILHSGPFKISMTHFTNKFNWVTLNILLKYLDYAFFFNILIYGGGYALFILMHLTTFDTPHLCRDV